MLDTSFFNTHSSLLQYLPHKLFHLILCRVFVDFFYFAVAVMRTIASRVCFDLFIGFQVHLMWFLWANRWNGETDFSDINLICSFLRLFIIIKMRISEKIPSTFYDRSNAISIWILRNSNGNCDSDRILAQNFDPKKKQKNKTEHTRQVNIHETHVHT